jgi:hypothetical protein
VMTHKPKKIKRGTLLRRVVPRDDDHPRFYTVLEPPYLHTARPGQLYPITYVVMKVFIHNTGQVFLWRSLRPPGVRVDQLNLRQVFGVDVVRS